MQRNPINKIRDMGLFTKPSIEDILKLKMTTPPDNVIILGAGMTGLALGLASGYPVFEARDRAGGICTSYYIHPGHQSRLSSAPEDGSAYRFEYGGRHWIFGQNPAAIDFISSYISLNSYQK